MRLLDIICHNSKVVILPKTNKSYLIGIIHLCVLLLKRHLQLRKNIEDFCDFSRYDMHVRKRVVKGTMRLHNFVKVSKFYDEYLADT